MKKSSPEPDVALILHNIRSAHNVGSMFRTADAIGIRRVILSGYTPAPVDRFGFPDKAIAKTALGAEKSIRWEKVPTAHSAIDLLKEEGFTIVGVEQDPRAVDYKRYILQRKTAILMGNEVRGIAPSTRKLCDALVEIPMRGKKESLNVGVAFGIIAYRLFDR